MMSYKDEGGNQTGSLNKGATHMENIVIDKASKGKL